MKHFIGHVVRANSWFEEVYSIVLYVEDNYVFDLVYDPIRRNYYIDVTYEIDINLEIIK